MRSEEKTTTYRTAIQNFRSNTRKTAKAKQTAGFIQARIKLLEDYWQKYCDARYSLVAEASEQPADKKLSEHAQLLISDRDFFETETTYCETLGELTDYLQQVNSQSTVSPSTSANIQQSTPVNISPSTHLPAIKIPSFDGSFLNWFPFKDLFVSVVKSNQHISSTQKLQYLKDALVGEAAHVLDNIPTTDAHFIIAWDLLVQKYENKRIIINSFLTQIINLPAVHLESASSLRTLNDRVTSALRALEQLERPVHHWDDWLVYLVVNKLDGATRKAWELSIKSNAELPTFTALQEFLGSHIQSLEMLQTMVDANSCTKLSKDAGSKSKSFVKNMHTTTQHCHHCSGKHIVSYCNTFKRLPLSQKRDIVVQHKLCFNCLRQGHSIRSCPSKGRCQKCQSMHHTSLHDEQNQMQNKSNPTEAVESVSAHNVHLPKPNSVQKVLLGTAVIEAQSDMGQRLHLRALIDSGAEATFISDFAANQLKLRRTPNKVAIHGANGDQLATSKGTVFFKLHSLTSQFYINCEALVLPRVGSITPTLPIPDDDLLEFLNLNLADPKFNKPGAIDLILSASDYAAILKQDIKRSKAKNFIAQNTQLGWVIFGGVSTTINARNCYLTHVDLGDRMRKFWEVEEVSVKPQLTPDDKFCEDLFAFTHTRNSSGRYIVHLPIKPDADLSKLAGSKRKAILSLTHVQHRLSQNPIMTKMYTDFIQEYHDLGHMEVVPEHDTTNPTCYLPHHGVYKESSSTTKLRVVFNASSRGSAGVSLNDCIHVGPKLQSDASDVTVNWRRHRVAFTGDIEKMYRQILVNRNDVDLQRIVWRVSSSAEPISFRLLTVTYGTNCAPYLAIKVLHTLASEEEQRFPIASKILKTEFYVDDALSGGESPADALNKVQELTALLKTAGFHLRKFNSNSTELLAALPAVDLAHHDALDLSLNNEAKALGLVWYTQSDHLGFKINFDFNKSEFTKRQMLSELCKIFDPLGFLAPFVIRGKISLQQLWLSGLDWNDQLPPELAQTWQCFRKELQKLPDLRIQRWLDITPDSTIEFHTFADASQFAYAACVYVRSVRKNLTSVNLVMAKTKVAPLKKLTIPRLELCAAVLAAKLLKKVKEAFSLHDTPSVFWTDSTTVLCWIRSPPIHLKEFVANRVTLVQELTNIENWKYVPTSQNPADCASRGISVQQLIDHPSWWHGPSWLILEKPQWPAFTFDNPKTVPESKGIQALTTQTIPNLYNLLARFSELNKLLAVVAWCFRFFNNCKKTSARSTSFCDWYERYTALKRLVSLVQRIEFHEEFLVLQQNKFINRRSKLFKLNPTLDAENVLRIGSRLKNANIPFNEKCPMILPKDNPLTTLLIINAHQRVMHGGTQATLAAVRRQFWVIDGRTSVKKVIKRCIPCFRHNCNPVQQIMGNLPRERCNITLPFLHVGVDYAGPFLIRTTKGRGHKSYKGYVALFICMATRAINLELVSDMTTESFVAALKRFTSVRGCCSDLYSDHGTTFVGADALLQEERKLFLEQLKAGAMYSSQNGIQWHFIPPGAPNFGGLWEAGVKSMKYLLKRSVNTAALTFEEFYTVLKQVEGCLNSRPLAPLSDDAEDLAAITPGHFLTGRTITAIAETNLLDTRIGMTRRWKQVSQMCQDFWKRWSSEYLHNLHARTKWQRQYRNVKVGQLVLIRDERLPPRQWMLGRITETHSGPDGAVRVVTLKTQMSTLRRPISKISVLPLDNIESSLDGGRRGSSDQ